jgi:sulfoxide reductase heme-binding subunit YedZ
VALLPLAWLVWGAVANTLGANPAEALIRGTGDWTLRLLCLTLAVTPLRQLPPAGMRWRAAPHAGPVHLLLRRAALPVLCLAGHGAGPGGIVRDIPKRPFILVGTRRCC